MVGQKFASLAYGNCRLRLSLCFACFTQHVKGQFREKIQKFQFFVLVSQECCRLQHLIIQVKFYYLSSSCLPEVKSRSKFQAFSPKLSGHGHL